MTTTSTENGGQFLTTRQAAARLGVTLNSLKTWIRDEHLPALRTPGGHHRIAERDLMAFQARLTENSKVPSHMRPRVLVVDDDKGVLEVVRGALAQAVPEAIVNVATDGYEALVQVGAFRPDLLVLDLRMPRLDGFEVCQRLKGRRETMGIRILAMTAYADPATRERILACGADDFLEKPFRIEKFASHVASLLGLSVGR